MARVNVEQTALTDPRYALLGSLLGENKYAALGRMVYLWNYCQETSSYVLKTEIVNFIFENLTGMSEALLTSGLGKKHRHGIYISGTKGRIEWLQIKRDNGKKGGRPKKNPQDTGAITEPKPIGSPSANPPAPAPAPAPAKEKKNTHSTRFTRTAEEVEAYCVERNSPIDGLEWYRDRETEGFTYTVKGVQKPVTDQNWKGIINTWTSLARKRGEQPSELLTKRRLFAAQATVANPPYWQPFFTDKMMLPHVTPEDRAARSNEAGYHVWLSSEVRAGRMSEINGEYRGLTPEVEAKRQKAYEYIIGIRTERGWE